MRGRASAGASPAAPPPRRPAPQHPSARPDWRRACSLLASANSVASGLRCRVMRVPRLMSLEGSSLTARGRREGGRGGQGQGERGRASPGQGWLVARELAGCAGGRTRSGVRSGGRRRRRRAHWSGVGARASAPPRTPLPPGARAPQRVQRAAGTAHQTLTRVRVSAGGGLPLPLLVALVGLGLWEMQAGRWLG